ncbi:AMP-binding protein [Caulobacter sp. SSI4214]|uniref:class I adenylate-forming enzyme family protein n=1 Tax=Caulobacter sp. SSI4214 TaxID=2575739 RepID=UPI00143CBE4E|nr:AMP-binding protein [Caulobacter sp. SSI4214]
MIDAQCVERADFEVLTVVDIGPDGELVDVRRSFGQLRANARRLAAWLQAADVAPGDRFALMLHNHVELVEAMIAAALIGATFVPIDPRSIGDKLVYMLDFVEAKLVIAGDYALGALAEVASRLVHTQRVLVVGERRLSDRVSGLTLHHYDRDLPATDADLTSVEPDPAIPMFMMFTSGTTGHPKAVVRSHATHMAGIKGLRALGVQAGDKLYTGLPLSHINAQSTLGAGLSLALPVVLSRKFTKSRLWDICRAHGCTVFTLLGGMIPEIYSVPERPDDADNPVRLIITSGMPAALWNEYRRRFGVEITEVYGSTEAGGVLINLKGAGPVGSLGKPPRGTLAAVLDPSGEPCPPGELGELCFRPESTEATPVTYFRNAAASQEKIRSGWFRSGDIAHMDAEGWFYFHHRVGGGVRRNGDFVNTALVETVLARCSLVEDVFVYGATTPSNVAGEKTLVAAVVLRSGAALADLRVWCADKLQKNETPEIWQILPAIPKTISEKPVERDCIALLHEHGLIASPALSRTP